MQFPSAAACIQHDRAGCNGQSQPPLQVMSGFGNLGIAALPHDALAYSLGLLPPQNLDRKDSMDIMPPMAHSSHMMPNLGQQPGHSNNMGNGEAETTKKKHKKKRKHKDGVPAPHINFTEEGRSYTAGVQIMQGAEHGMLKYKCKICPQEYFTRSDVMLHARSHKEGKPHKCNTCGKGFATTSYLQQHLRIHSNEKPYPCAYCEKGFKQLSHLQQHTRIHTGDRPYKCDFQDCDKSFTQLANLQQHWRRHNKDKPYKCRECYRAYDELDKLTSHVQSHTNTRREKRFSCGVCGKNYAQELYLMKHMAKHPQLAGVRPELAMQIHDPKLNNQASTSSSCTVHKKKHKHKHKCQSSSSSTSTTTPLPPSALASLPTQVLINSLPTMVTTNYNASSNNQDRLQVSSPEVSRAGGSTDMSNNVSPDQKNFMVTQHNQHHGHHSPHYSQSPMMNTPMSTAATIASNAAAAAAAHAAAAAASMSHRGHVIPSHHHHPAMFASPPQAQRFDITGMTTAGTAVSMSLAAYSHVR